LLSQKLQKKGLLTGHRSRGKNRQLLACTKEKRRIKKKKRKQGKKGSSQPEEVTSPCRGMSGATGKKTEGKGE